MNRATDFRKKTDGVVVNTNSMDHSRARNRNLIRKEQATLFGDKGRIVKLEQELSDIKSLLIQLMEK